MWPRSLRWAEPRSCASPLQEHRAGEVSKLPSPGRTSRRSSLRSGLCGGWLCACCVSSRHLDRLGSGLARIRLGEQASGGVNGAARSHLRAAPQGGIAQFREELFQREAAHDFATQKPVIDYVGIFLALHHELVEAGCLREEYVRVLAE